jgi:hypothetical protein
MQQLLSRLDAARALLASLSPGNYLADALASVGGAISGLQSQGQGYVNQLDSLTDITDDVSRVLGLANDAANFLTTANAATLGAVVAYSEMASALLNSGVHAFAYTGALSSLGSELDAATPATSVGGGSTIGGVILFAKTADSATLTSLNSVFGI